MPKNPNGSTGSDVPGSPDAGGSPDADVLSKEFVSRESEYKEMRISWQSWYIVALMVAIAASVAIVVSVYSFGVISQLAQNGTNEQGGAVLSFIGFIPVYSFLIWSVIFVANRRAESAKIEEIYRHKKTMVEIFFVYKETIEGLKVDDKSLLVKHTENLLEAIKKDPSDALSPKGEKHPVIDIFRRGKPPSSD